MKILLVSPVSPQLPKTQPLPLWQAQNFWRLALKKLGHQVKVFRLNDFPQIKFIKSLQLQQTIKQFNPDEIFFSGGIDAVKPVKKTVFFSGVPAAVLSKSERQTGLEAKLVVANDPLHVKQWKKLGVKQAVCLPISAIDTNFFKPQSVKKTIPVSLVVTLFPSRQRFLSVLTRYYSNIQVYGWIPPKLKLFPELTKYYHGQIWGKDLIKIYSQSIISLNLTPVHMSHGGNLRTFEIPASKSLMMTDNLNSQWYKPNQEAIVFSSPQNLAKKINYYLKHPAKTKQITQAGYQRAIKNHTYQHRFRSLIKLLSNVDKQPHV